MNIKKQLIFIEKIIKNYGLKPASQRNFPLFSQSVINFGYTVILKKELGYSYEAVCVLGKAENSHTMYNEEHIIKETEKFLRKSGNLDKSLKKAKNIFKKFKNGIENNKNIIKEKPEIFLKYLAKNYFQYARSIGVYNCFWRYVGNNEDKLSAKEIRRIIKEREEIGKYYPFVENLIKLSADFIGAKYKYNGDILRYLSAKEMSRLKNFKISKKLIKELTARSKKYIYVYVEKNNKEIIINDYKIIKEIEDKYYKHNAGKVKEIKGFSAFKGLVKGKILNLQNIKNRNSIDAKNKIIVVSMTHPKDIFLLKQCKAIITDEGGILSHAAIVSRELKRPCIIGTKIATQILKDGDMVEVDADKGIIKVL